MRNRFSAARGFLSRISPALAVLLLQLIGVAAYFLTNALGFVWLFLLFLGLLLFAGGREGWGSMSFGSKCFVFASIAIPLFVLPLGTIHNLGLWNKLSWLEVLLFVGLLTDLFLAAIAVFNRSGLSAPGRIILLCWALLAACARLLHYDLAYAYPDRGVSTDSGYLNYQDGFRLVAWTGIGANFVLIFLPVVERFTRVFRISPLAPWRSPFWFLLLLGLVAALLLIPYADPPDSWPVFLLLAALGPAVWAGAGMQRSHRFIMMCCLLFVSFAVFFADPGLVVTYFFVVLCLIVYIRKCERRPPSPMWRRMSSVISRMWRWMPSVTSRKKETGSESDGVSPVFSPIWSNTGWWIAGLLSLLLLLVVPFLFELLTMWLSPEGPPDSADQGWLANVVLRRVFAVMHPGSGGDFAEHMYTAQMAMRSALEHGGLFGDGGWGNGFWIPQINSDFVLARLFWAHGLAGWAPLGLVAVFLTALWRLPLTKAFNGDHVHVKALGGVVVATFAFVAVLALQVLGGLGHWLPWAGLPFPFLARGVFLHGTLAFLVGAVVFLDIGTLPAVRTPKLRRVWWMPVGSGIPAGFVLVAGVFAWQVQLPALRPASERYILLPENVGEVVRLEPRTEPDTLESDTLEYRVGDAIVRLAFHRERHVEDFAYISGYEFNEARARGRGISIGQTGRFSPVLDPPLLGAYVHKANDVILYWEEEMDDSTRLFLSTSSRGIRVIELPTAGVETDLGREVGWQEVGLNDVLPWGATLRIGGNGTKLRFNRVASDSEALRIELDPDSAHRAYSLREKQGPHLRISRTRETVIGGQRLARSAITSGRRRMPGTWVEHDRHYDRGALLDRSGRELVQRDGDKAEFEDPNLVFLIGTAGGGSPFGLEHVFDYILSGYHRRGTVLDVTKRTLRKEKLPREDIFLTIDLTRQRKLTDVVREFAANDTDAPSGSAVILDGDNRILALGDFDRSPDVALPSDPGAQGVSVRFDATFWEGFEEDLAFLRYDSVSSKNPFLRRPLPGAFATELTGSVFKGIIYAIAFEDQFAGGRRWFTEVPDVRDALVLALPGDSANTTTRGGSRVLTSENALVSFGDFNFGREIRNYSRAPVSPELGPNIAASGNIPPAYLALGLSEERWLQALVRFGLRQELLLRPEAFPDHAPFLNDAAYVLAEPIRFADPFDWSNDSDRARLGLGDKVYLSLVHVAAFYATVLLHEGDFVHPTVVHRIGEDPVRPPRFPVFESAGREQTVEAMKTLFRLPLETGGTGADFAQGLPSNVQVRGGKTGTASVPNRDPHRIFVAIVEIDGEAYTIATRVKHSPAPRNEALVLARRIVLDVLR